MSATDVPSDVDPSEIADMAPAEALFLQSCTRLAPVPRERGRFIRR